MAAALTLLFSSRPRTEPPLIASVITVNGSTTDAPRKRQSLGWWAILDMMPTSSLKSLTTSSLSASSRRIIVFTATSSPRKVL